MAEMEANAEVTAKGALGAAIGTTLYPATIDEVLSRWDNGQTVWSIEMGGLGPSYEQAIQVVAMELIRAIINRPEIRKVMEKQQVLTDDQRDVLNRFMQEETHRIDREKELEGITGAMASAGQNIAFMFTHHGPAEAIKQAGADRRIQISKSWPKP